MHLEDCRLYIFYSQSILWASVSVPTDSVPTTQSPKREVGTIALWPQAGARHDIFYAGSCEKCQCMINNNETVYA